MGLQVPDASSQIGAVSAHAGEHREPASTRPSLMGASLDGVPRSDATLASPGSPPCPPVPAAASLELLPPEPPAPPMSLELPPEPLEAPLAPLVVEAPPLPP